MTWKEGQSHTDYINLMQFITESVAYNEITYPKKWVISTQVGKPHGKLAITLT